MFTKIWWVHTLFTKKDEKKEKKKVGRKCRRERGRDKPLSGLWRAERGWEREDGRPGRTACVAPADKKSSLKLCKLPSNISF